MNRCRACGRDAGQGRAFCIACEQLAKEAIVREHQLHPLREAHERCPICAAVAARVRPVEREDGREAWVVLECAACLWRILLSHICPCGRPLEWFPGGEPGVFYCMGCLRSFRLEGVSFRPRCPSCGRPMLWSVPMIDEAAPTWACVCGQVKPAAAVW